MENIIFNIRSGYSFIYCRSQEVNDSCLTILQELKKYYQEKQVENNIKLWDFEMTNELGESNYNDPNSLLMELENIREGVDEVPAGTIVVAKNYNWFLGDDYGNWDKGKISWFLNRADKFSSSEYRKVLIIVGQAEFEKAIPPDLKREFANIEINLPDKKDIEEIYKFIIDSAKENPKFKIPNFQESKRIISGAMGLTKSEVTKVFSYSIIKNNGRLDPQTVEELRAEEINKTPGLKIGHYDKKLEDLQGYGLAKEIVDEWIDDPEAKGCLLLGPAGVGKTHFCQSLASHYKRLIIEIEFAQLMGDGLVGQAEKAMKRALDVITANANPEAPIILFIDEIEKGLAGTNGAGSTKDGGTTERSNAQFLKFLSDARPKGIYVVASCNDIEKLPAAYVRAERWDTAPIFVDLPNKQEQLAILKHYQKTYNISEQPYDMKEWTGAEIKAWCKLAAKKKSLGKPVEDADDLIVPIARTMNKEIDYLRQWKEGRTIPASKKVEVVKKEKTRNRKIEL